MYPIHLGCSQQHLSGADSPWECVHFDALESGFGFIPPLSRVYVYICVYIYMCIYVYICVYMCIYVYICVYICIYMYIYLLYLCICIYIYIDTYGIRNFLVILQSAVSVVSVVSGQGCLLAKELDASKNFINHTALKMLLTVLKEIGGKIWSRNIGLVGLEHGFYDFHFILMGNIIPTPLTNSMIFQDGEIAPQPEVVFVDDMVM